MIYLSAQPDTPYFMWQLEVQLHNFASFGISPDNIHILIGYDPVKGISSCFQDFTAANPHLARFFFYPDTRLKRRYIPSIRPHIIKQHFFKHPELAQEAIFYHDSDIVFTSSLPDFEQLVQGDTWYVSDARHYLNSDYIRAAGQGVFTDMCRIMDIDEQLVIDNDANAGGAQTLLKNVDYTFWDQLESDSEKIFCLLIDNRDSYKKTYLEENAGYETHYTPVQAWCSDMWAILWNGFKRAEVRISGELDFCWPHESQDSWEKKKIFHNAGISAAMSNRFFFKAYYMERTPYEDDFSHVVSSMLSYNYVQMIYETAKGKRYNMQDVTFTMTVRVDSDERLENLITVLRFINTHIDTNFLLLEADVESRIPAGVLPDNVRHIFVKDERDLYFRQPYNNYLLRIATTPIVVKYDVDIIVPPSQMNSAVNSIRFGKHKISYPYDGRFVDVYGVLRTWFIRTLDMKSFYKYLKMSYSPQPSYGGCVILHRETFYEMGVDNEQFNGWGFEDQETPKRAKILGMEVFRADGPLFHLHHPRGTHSYFYNEAETLNSLREYIRVCNMTKNELQLYISNWKNSTVHAY